MTARRGEVLVECCSHCFCVGLRSCCTRLDAVTGGAGVAGKLQVGVPQDSPGDFIQIENQLSASRAGKNEAAKADGWVCVGAKHGVAGSAIVTGAADVTGAHSFPVDKADFIE